ncbi:alpha-2,3-sialyltransferase [Rhizobium rhizophilum]|uniref:Uncharacterized protein n=1 Tax=Rhizobium rhizophilum TaxID=1850373 RepID=A0ABY2QN44_9HYPH|nr:alpha-2,3-sialyltransferase [Rhizobium rhizophilum]THV10569.1 hypothetical protein E9677_22705 [Rhizobium rhizophilum]
MKLPQLAIGSPDAGRFGERFIVAGNGPTMVDLDRAQFNIEDTIIRVNSFFFEPEYFIGRRVDILQIGGDRWIFPFFAKTLGKVLAAGLYDVRHWSCHQPDVAQGARCQVGRNEVALCYKDSHTRDYVVGRCLHYGRLPTTGVYALLNAHALGAKYITIAGMDFYAADRRYMYELGPRNERLLHGSAKIGYNGNFHDQRLDLDIVRYLADKQELTLYRTNSATSALEFLDLAPDHHNVSHPPCVKPVKITDFESRVGVYPIALMQILRRMRELQIQYLRRK